MAYRNISSMNEKFETVCDILNNLGYVIDNRDIGTNTVRFNLPAIGNHDGYAIRVNQSKYNSDMHIFDGGIPLLDLEDGSFCFSSDRTLLEHTKKLEYAELKKILSTRTNQIIEYAKQKKKEWRRHKIEEL